MHLERTLFSDRFNYEPTPGIIDLEIVPRYPISIGGVYYATLCSSQVQNNVVIRLFAECVSYQVLNAI